MTDSSSTRERLLDSAIVEFANFGFEGATVRDICGRAQANVNAINYHFGDKQQLYVEAVKAAHRKIRSVPGVALIDQIAEQFEGDPEQRLKAFIQGMVTMAMSAENRTDIYHQLMFREIGKPTIATEHLVREFIEPQFSRLTRILNALLPEGTSRIDKRLLGLSIIGQCLHYKFAAPILPLLITKQEQKQLSVQRVSDHIYDVTLAAIQARL